MRLAAAAGMSFLDLVRRNRGCRLPGADPGSSMSQPTERYDERDPCSAFRAQTILL